MGNLLIRNVPPTIMQILKDRARVNGSSLQAEAYDVLVSNVKPTGAQLVAWLETVRPKDLSPEQVKELVDFGTEAIRAARDER